MKHEPIDLAGATSLPLPMPLPRRLIRGWWVVRDGLPSMGRYRRYLMMLVPALAAIWGMTAAYLVLTPRTYTSTMTLILPGTGVGGSINLDQIGQASTTTASAFSGSTLSPTENYKRLLAADVTLRRAAALAGEDGDRFPQPVVKLTDQTNLIEVKISGRSPKQAHRRAEALRRAFLAGLTTLRRDEAATREAADRANIARLQVKARDAQRRVLAFQAESGLVSLEQFGTRMAALDGLRQREREARTVERQQSASTGQLAHAIGANAASARLAMLLKADPQFQSLLSRYAQIGTDGADRGAVLGPNHGAVAELNARDGGVRDALVARGRALTGMSERALLSFADLSVADGRAQLFQNLVNGDSQSAGARAAVAEIRGQIGEQSREARRLVGSAGELTDLLRDQRVAEAVFSSALARLDTNKSDPFASYPLVQTLEAPSLPGKPSSPSTLIGLAGAVAASFLVLFGFLVAWLRQPIIRRILPNA